MRIIITTDDGEQLEVFEDVQNLVDDNPTLRADLLGNLKEAIKQGRLHERISDNADQLVPPRPPDK
jgi:hypothetical protein